MPTIESIIRQVNQGLVPQFEAKLRQFLAKQDRDWLIDQIILLALDAHSLQERDRQHWQAAKAQQRAERLARLRKMGLNPHVLAAFLARYQTYDRARVVQEGYLLARVSPKGTTSQGGLAVVGNAIWSRCATHCPRQPSQDIEPADVQQYYFKWIP